MKNFTTYTPDRWVVIDFKSDDHGSIRKVLASWYGGYLYGDSWKLSSGIVDVEEKDGCFYFKNHSGSMYVCHREAHGISRIMSSLVTSWEKAMANEPTASMTIEELT